MYKGSCEVATLKLDEVKPIYDKTKNTESSGFEEVLDHKKSFIERFCPCFC